MWDCRPLKLTQMFRGLATASPSPNPTTRGVGGKGYTGLGLALVITTHWSDCLPGLIGGEREDGFAARRFAPAQSVRASKGGALAAGHSRWLPPPATTNRGAYGNAPCDCIPSRRLEVKVRPEHVPTTGCPGCLPFSNLREGIGWAVTQLQ